jgi:hypothetical protein
MAFVRTMGALFGTDESTLATVANGTTVSGAEVDVLGDNASLGEAWLYCVVTASVVSSIDVTINQRRVTGQAYSKLAADINIPTINGTSKIPLGKWPVSRFLQADVHNFAGSSITAAILYELEKFTP